MKRFLPLMVALLLSSMALAQAPGTEKVTARLDRNRISMNETATLTVSVQGLSSNVQLPEPKSRNGGLQFNHIGQRFSMTSINGVSNAATEYDYEVVPVKGGRHIIEPISGTVSGIRFTTKSLRLEVTSGQSGVTVNPSTGYRNPYMNRRNRIRRNVFTQRGRPDDVLLEAKLKPDVVYKHQPTVFNLKLMNAVQLYADPRYHPVSPTGFLAVPHKAKSGQEYRNGRTYQVNEIDTAFYPLTEGTYEFPATEIKVQTGSIYLPAKSLVTKKQTLKVLPLPTKDRPRSFTGAVGESFEISAFLSEKSVVEGQTVTLTVSVKGDGHLQLVPYPYIPDLDGVERKQASSPSTTTIKNGKLDSRRTYNFRLKPTKAGTFDLSDIAIAFFRPSQERYEIVKSAPLKLEVKPGGEALRTGGSELAKELKEPDRPMIDPGNSHFVVPHLESRLFFGSLVLLVLGLLLNLRGQLNLKSGTKGSAWSRGRKHTDLSALLAHLSEIAPGPDSLSRQRHLLSLGWSDQQIEKLEQLRTQASGALYASFSGGPPPPKVSELSSVLRTLLKEVKKR